MNHKRRRPPVRRGASCLCHGMAKKLRPNKLSGEGHNRREMQLRVRAQDFDADEASGDPCRDGSCRACTEAA